MRKLIFAVALLAGCSTTTVPVAVDKPVFHPEWPTPYRACNIDWEVLVIDNTPYVALEYDESLTLAICERDKLRYIKDINSKFCTYRPKEDPRCTQKSTSKKE